MNALSIFTQLPSTAQERASFIRAAKDEIINGERNIVDVYPMITNIVKLFDDLKKDTEFRDMLSKAVNGRTVNNGFEITEQVVKKYNCAECHDSEWNSLMEQMNELKEKIKAREAFLIAIPATGTANPETGEMIYPPVVTFETRFVVKQAK